MVFTVYLVESFFHFLPVDYELLLHAAPHMKLFATILEITAYQEWSYFILFTKRTLGCILKVFISEQCWNNLIANFTHQLGFVLFQWRFRTVFEIDTKHIVCACNVDPELFAITV